MKKITAVTVNYSRSVDTKKLLESLSKALTEDYSLNVIVVDNSSKKDFEVDKKYNFPVEIIKPVGNTGFSKGNNIGIKKALSNGADFVLLINDDTTIFPDLISELYKAIELKAAGVVSPKIYFSKGQEFHKDRYVEVELGNVIWFAGGVMDWDNAKSIHTGVDLVDRGQFENMHKVDFATGCCMLIKKEVFEKIGFFDENYFLYYEDADFCQRVINAGFEIYFVPKARMYHANASSSGGAGNQLHDYFLTRNQMLFGMKYAPVKTKAALIRQSMKLLISGRKYQKKGVQDYFIKKFGKGTYFKQ